MHTFIGEVLRYLARVNCGEQGEVGNIAAETSDAKTPMVNIRVVEVEMRRR